METAMERGEVKPHDCGSLVTLCERHWEVSATSVITKSPLLTASRAGRRLDRVDVVIHLSDPLPKSAVLAIK